MAAETLSLHYLRHALRGLLIFVSGTALAQESEHIFEPGKKHVCVPAANGQGWDCGTAEQPPAAPARHEGPELRSSRANDPASISIADAAEPEPASAPTESSESKPQSRAVPNYLLAAPSDDASSSNETQSSAPSSSASAEPPAEMSHAATAAKPATETSTASTNVSHATETLSQPSASSVEAAPATNAPAPPTSASSAAASAVAATGAANPAKDTNQTNTQSAAAAASPAAAAVEPTHAPTPAESASTEVAVATAPAPPAPTPPVASTAIPEPIQNASPRSSGATISDADERQQRASFAALPANAYVLELAHGSEREQVAVAASSVLPQGRTWLLRLSHDSSVWYVALWGEFPSVEAARAARDVAANQGLADVGWPRRVGPLQQELRLQH